MKGLNMVHLIGNLGASPEMKFTPTGKPTTSFSLATSRKYKADDGNLVEQTTWHKVITWGPLAEAVNKSLEKGAPVYVMGRIDNRSWDGTDGQKHYTSEVIAQDVIFLGRPTTGRPDDGAKLTPEESATESMTGRAKSPLVEKAISMGAKEIIEDAEV